METGTSDQVISLPSGGGALKGLGETFAPDLQTGTGDFTVPIALPPGRNGLQPELALTYSTGGGNGPFGLGWSVGIPGVARKTSKGVPRYRPARAPLADRDTFVLSGAEDLVPVEESASETRYRPRTERAFARIAHHHGGGDDHWEVKGKDGVVSRYGTPGRAGDDPAVIAFPGAERRTDVAAWNLTATADPFGNRIAYGYRRDRVSQGARRWDQLYPDLIRYVDYDEGGQTQYLVSVHFEYEDRPDAFSGHRSGFEIRTRLRCTAIHVRVHDAGTVPVRTYRLLYLDQRDDLAALVPPNGVSLLSQVQVIGYDDAGRAYDGTVRDGRRRELQSPPLELRYSRLEPAKRAFEPVAGASLPPRSLGSPDLEVADVFGDGLPHVLEMNGRVRVWRNRGGARFDEPQQVRDLPAGISLGRPDVRLVDADGDGRIDLLARRDGLPGFFALAFSAPPGRPRFRRHAYAPSFDLGDVEVNLVDLDGDGVVDAIRSGARMELFFNDPRRGWDPGRTRQVLRRAPDVFPDVSFADPRVRWGDMTGDGLQDVVLVHDGNVEYWPSLGHGDWAPRVHMRNSPRLPAGYDPRRLLLGDVDGDGLADLVLVEAQRVVVWINRSGNAWSDPIEISGTPSGGPPGDVRLEDLFGLGVRGVLWSADPTAPGRPHVHFLDLTGGTKPYLLNHVDNRMGAVTDVAYGSSVACFLADQRRPELRWRAGVPFPVQVVRRVDTVDAFTGNRLTREFRYHHGHWDGAEREFLGFGMVEQLDAEVPGDDVAAGQLAPPALTRTWFHVGAAGEEFGQWQEQWTPDALPGTWSGDSPLLARSAQQRSFLAGLPRRVRRDAVRALRGAVLRTELYALDGSDRQERPYTVTEALHEVREVVDGAGGTHALRDVPRPGDRGAAPGFDDPPRVFFPGVAAQRTTRWDRGDDPQTRFTFTDAYDAYGQPGRQTSIACPRGWRRMADAPAVPYLATRTRTEYGTSANPGVFIVDRVASTTTWEIGQTAGRTVVFLRDLADDDARLEVVAQRLLYYDGQAFAGLPLRRVGRYGATVRTEALVLTQQRVDAGYGAQPPPYLAAAPAAWTAEYPQGFRNRTGAAGYRRPADPDHAPGWFADVERRRFDFHGDPGGAGRGMLLETRDALGKQGVFVWDAYELLPVEARAVTDPVRPAPDDALVTRAAYNYRTVQPARVVDPNGNVREYAFSPLGLLSAAWTRGKDPPAAPEGDQAFPSLVLDYDLLACHRSPAASPQPIWVRAIRRVYHDSQLEVAAARRGESVEVREYSDGFGRLLQTRRQADSVRFGDPVLPADQAAGPGPDVLGVENTQPNRPNVVVSGWQVYDNKGRALAKYEPFFDAGWDYRRPAAGVLAQRQAVRLYYDPNGQVVRTVAPDGSEQRVVNGVPADLARPDRFEPMPWETYTYDANDLAPLCTTPTGASAAGGAPVGHHFTPRSIEVDALGRVVRTVERTGPAPGDQLVKTCAYDIRGNLVRVDNALGRIAFAATYDLADRRIRVADPQGGTRRSVFDAAGNLLELRDQRDAVTLRSYDRLHRPARLWARDRAGEPVTLRERLAYGDEPALGLAPDRNLRGLLYRHDDEAGRVTYERYDFRGNLLEKRRRPLSDAAVLAPFSAPGPGGIVLPFRVDWNVHGPAQLEPALAVTYTYDALGRVETVRHPRDADGQRKTTRFRYDRAGLLAHIEVDGRAVVERIAYNARAERVLTVLGNGLMTRYAWNPWNFRLRRQRTERFTAAAPLTYRGTPDPAPADRVIQDSVYEHDLAGNLVALHERSARSGTTVVRDRLDRRFTYDPLYRLRGATGRECVPPAGDPWSDANRCHDLTRTQPYDETYTYDDVGNLRTLRHSAAGGFTRTLVPAAGSDRLARLELGGGIPAWSYQHDANGNVTEEGSSRHFEWDHADRLRAYRTQTAGAAPTLHATYLYDAAGQRVKRLVRKGPGRWETTVYVEDVFEAHRLMRPAGALEQQRLLMSDAGQRVAELRVGPAFPGDGAADAPVTYCVADHLGSSEVVVGGADATARSFIRREEFTPFGETAFGGYGRKRYRFTGKERDEGSGLYYHGARYYAPWLGRWTSCDPGVDLDDLNRYAYARNSPLVLRDPDGRDAGTSAAAGTAVSLSRFTAPGPATVTELLKLPVRAPPVVAPAAGAGALTWAGVGAAVVGVFALWTAFYLKAGMRSTERAEERVRRAAQAENLRQDGLITWEEANEYIVTGQLFIPRDRAADRSLGDAYREKWFELGRQFQQHVLDTVLKSLHDRGQLEVEIDVGTVTGTRKPDFSRWDPRVPGAFAWIGDAKLGRIELDDQMRGLIDEATRTTKRILILFTPEGVKIPKSVLDAAAAAGIDIIQIEVPFMPDYVPKTDGKAAPKADPGKATPKK